MSLQSQLQMTIELRKSVEGPAYAGPSRCSLLKPTEDPQPALSAITGW